MPGCWYNHAVCEAAGEREESRMEKRRMKKWQLGLLLVVCAAVMAVGLEMLQSALMPHVYVNSEAEAGGVPTWLDPATGRLALRESWSALRLAATFLLQLAVLVIIFPLGLGRAMLRALKAAWIRVASLWKRERIRDTLLHAALFLLCGGAAFFLIRAMAEDTVGKSNWMVNVFSAAAAFAAAMLFTFRRTLSGRPEAFFLAFTLLIGGLWSFLLPDATTVSWDDGHHYQHALNYSTIGRVRFTQQDMNAMEAHNERFYGLGEERQAWLRAQDELNAGGAVYVTSDFHIQPKQIWSGTQGLGLFLGRLFHLSYWMTWSLGRFTGLLAYAVIGFFAIRRLRSGRMILSLALMIPEAVFLASNYSYDPGVTCLTALGLATCFGIWQTPEKKMTLADAAVMIGAMTLGCLAKAIYFPLLCLPFFLPKNRFASVSQRRGFFWANAAAIGLLLVSFLLPMVMGGSNGDERGGSDVNAFAQMQYILSQPLEYAETLLRFLGRYLSPAKAGGFLTSFAYMGDGRGKEAALMALAVAAFTDRSATDLELGRRKGLRALLLFLLFGTLCLVATSMFVSFTGVGKRSISGCQPRYLLPFVFPAMMLLGSGTIRKEGNRAVFNGALFAVMGWISFAAVLTQCVALYG